MRDIKNILDLSNFLAVKTILYNLQETFGLGRIPRGNRSLPLSYKSAPVGPTHNSS